MGNFEIATFSIFGIYFINVIFAIALVFFERRKPSSTWAWILVLSFIPVLGFIFYMFFGRDGKKERVFAEKAAFDRSTYYKYISYDEDYDNLLMKQRKFAEESKFNEDYKHLCDLALLQINSGNMITFNNTVDIYKDGKSKFDALFNDIANAKKFIHLEYYIIRNSKISRELLTLLEKKAEEGVKVRVLYDGMGCRTLPPHFFKKLRENGGEAVAFHPPITIRINYRNHRKIAVIDGEIGYVGGFNIGDEYLGRVKRYGYWRDTHIRITGDAVNYLQLRFFMDWNFCAGDKLYYSKGYFPKSSNTDSNVAMQIVSSGPDTKWKDVKNSLFKMITEAEKNLYITTPYFVPDDSILEAIKVAALSGVDVRIIIPGKPDHFFVYWASMSYMGQLLKAGVRCYQYEKGFIHSKTVVIDSVVTSVGTANMDVRSFDLNFEVNAFIFDKNVSVTFEKDFLDDLNDCSEITLKAYEERNLMFRIKEAVSRLISPLL